MKLSNTKILAVLTILIMGCGFFTTIYAQSTNLGDVFVRFCNDPDAEGGTSRLNTTATAGEPKEICILINNQGPTDAQVSLNFVDGTITADAEQKKACQPEGTKGQFGQYVEIDEREFIVESNSSVETTAFVTFPAGYAGMNYGCITYQLATQGDGAQDQMFNVVTRRANFIDILVDGNIELGVEFMAQTNDAITTNISDSSTVFIYFDENIQEYVARIIVKNVGNIPQEVSVEASFKDIFQAHDLDAQKKTILPQQTASFIFPIQDFIPFYEGPMEVDMVATHAPVFDFESDRITPDMMNPQTVLLSANFFVMPWKVIGILVALLVIIWLGSRGGNKSNNTPAPKPTPSKSKATKKKTSSTKKSAPKKSSKKDDLTKIDGVGPKIQELLNKKGIKSYQDLVDAKLTDLRTILKEAGSRYAMYDPKKWKQQAPLARDGKRTQLKELQKNLKQ